MTCWNVLLATLSSMITGVLYFDLQNLFVSCVNAAGGGGSPGVNVVNKEDIIIMGQT